MSDIAAEETVDRRMAFQGHLIDVRVDTVRLPSGKTTEREIVDHPDAIAIVPVLDDGRLVLVRQYRKPAERVLLEAVAGGIDDGETPEEAAHRELLEETGYRASHLERLCAFYTSPGFTTEFMYLFRATGLTAGEPTEETDQIEVVTLAVDQARAAVGGEIADAKTILALFYA